jgi:acyl-coenzyme A thioesterase 9
VPEDKGDMGAALRLPACKDALAGTIAYTHCDDEDPATRPLTIVTASVDRIDLTDRLEASEDLRLSGHVSYVGTRCVRVCRSLP